MPAPTAASVPLLPGPVPPPVAGALVGLPSSVGVGVGVSVGVGVAVSVGVGVGVSVGVWVGVGVGVWVGVGVGVVVDVATATTAAAAPDGALKLIRTTTVRPDSAPAVRPNRPSA
jgi:hypothetical protein